MKFKDNKIVKKTKELLLTGITPNKLALGISVAIMFGTIPVLGATTLLCSLFAVTLRLNLPLVNIVNYSVYPLQLILFIPFYKIGEWIFGFVEFNLNFNEVIEMLSTSITDTVVLLWDASLQAIGAWFIISVPVTIILYFLLLYLISNFSEKLKSIKNNSKN
ncbi:MAG: DUF2062 domain-containing protein [Melioribacteraceae bacterium]|nr:DUF2062 domain-containing protein [Melioribacteraceae bacterium]